MALGGSLIEESVFLQLYDKIRDSATTIKRKEGKCTCIKNVLSKLFLSGRLVNSRKVMLLHIIVANFNVNKTTEFIRLELILNFVLLILFSPLYILRILLFREPFVF